MKSETYNEFSDNPYFMSEMCLLVHQPQDPDLPKNDYCVEFLDVIMTICVNRFEYIIRVKYQLF